MPPGAQRAPDRDAALAMYRRRAGIYDVELAVFEPLRRQAIERLQLQPGEVVLDVGCGTGLSFEALAGQVGDRGTVVGIEQCPEMLGLARERAREHGWRQIVLVEAPAEAATIPTQADAALFHFTHDILRRPDAIANVVRHLKPGARVVATGLKWADPWYWPVNLLVYPAALHSVTSFEGMDAPWSHLGEQLGAFRVDNLLLGGAYVAHGIRMGPRASA